MGHVRQQTRRNRIDYSVEEIDNLAQKQFQTGKTIRSDDPKTKLFPRHRTACPERLAVPDSARLPAIMDPLSIPVLLSLPLVTHRMLASSRQICPADET